MARQLIPVTDNALERRFIELFKPIYKDDPTFIRPLDDDINNKFKPEKNKLLAEGEAQRWILVDDQQGDIGRVAAFINPNTKDKFDQPTGGMGFFECIDDQEAANMLFDQCKEWLEERGMEAMDGPINFGERNEWWGLLVDGFEEPIYLMNYNPPYYRQLFENYGFKTFFEQYSYGLPVDAPRPRKYYEKSEHLLENDKNYHFEHLKKDQIEKFTNDFRTIYNNAWGRHEGFREMSEDGATKIMKAMKPVLVDYLMWFGYYKDEPIALFFMLPELNQLFKHVNGKMNLIGKMKFMYHKLLKTNRKMFGMLFGVVPEHQGKGVEGAIIIAAHNVVIPKNRWDYMELTWIGDFNPKMMRVAENLGAKVVKTHITFRKLFDESREFKRAPIIE